MYYSSDQDMAIHIYPLIVLITTLHTLPCQKNVPTHCRFTEENAIIDSAS